MTTPNDVLSRRGWNNHPGNQRLKRIMEENSERWAAASRHQRRVIAADIVNTISNQHPPGRFLRWDRQSGDWMQVTHEASIHQVRQMIVNLRCWRRRELQRRQIRFLDEHNVSVPVENSAPALPRNVSSIEVHGILDPLRCNGFDCANLSPMLRVSQRRLRQMTIHKAVASTPEYLALFVATFNKTNRLRLLGPLIDNSEFGCLVAGMTQPDGLRDLELNLRRFTVSEHQMRLLFHGIAFSSCLEKLALTANCNMELMGPSCTEALQRNQTLRTLHVQLASTGQDSIVFSRLLRIVSETQVRDLKLSQEGSMASLPRNVWEDALIQQNCSIEKLQIANIKLVTDSNTESASIEGQPMTQNESIKELVLENSSLCDSSIKKISSRFKNLTSLNLSSNQLHDMSPFGELLFGDQLMLQSLNLENNEIDEQTMMVFVSQLPSLKHLRNLQLSGNPFLRSKGCVGKLESALLLNTSLERMPYSCRLSPGRNDESWCNKMDVHFSLNRGGRRSLLNEQWNSVNQKLWPLIVERAMNLSYYSTEDDWHQPSLDSTRVDVIFWLLREKVFA